MLAYAFSQTISEAGCFMVEVTTGPEANPPPDGAEFQLGWSFAAPRCGAWYLQPGRGVTHLFWIGPADKLNRGLTKEIQALMQAQRAMRSIQTGRPVQQCYAPILQVMRDQGRRALYYLCRLAPFGMYELDEQTGALRWHELRSSHVCSQNYLSGCYRPHGRRRPR